MGSTFAYAAEDFEQQSMEGECCACQSCSVFVEVVNIITVQITILIITVIVLVIILAIFLIIQFRLNTIIEKCCCCKKKEEQSDSCFNRFDVSYTPRTPPGATVPLYDITVSWNASSHLVDLEYKVARSNGWQKMGNQSPPEIFVDLPPSDSRVWTHVTGYAIIDCNEVIEIRGVCKSSSGAIIGYSDPPKQIILPCP